MDITNIINRIDVPDDIKAMLIASVRECEKLYRDVYEKTPALLAAFDQNGVIFFASDNWLDKFGYSRDEIVRHPLFDFLSEGSRARVQSEILPDLFRSGFCDHIAMGIQNKDGQKVEVVVSAAVNREAAPPLALAVFSEVGDPGAIESKLIESERKYHAIIRHTNTGYVMLDRSGRVLEANSVYVRFAGRQRVNEVLGRKPDEWTAQQDRERAAKSFHQAWETGSIRNLELNYLGEEGRLTPVEFHATVISVAGEPRLIALCWDISERKALEKKIIEAQKMDSIGNLAGGIAHDFNNMLMGILGCSSILMMEETNPEKRGYIEDISAAARKSAELTQKLLAFSRRTKPAVQNVNFNELVVEAIGIVKRVSDRTVRVITKLERDLDFVSGDPAQLSQVVMNLCVNAAEAMPAGGDLILQTHNVVFDQSFCRSFPNALPGPYVLLTVSDTGIGMDHDIQEKIFEPFFTTKISGDKKGTGLGLSTVYGIVNNHGGIITFFSKMGEGSTFKVYLPAIPREVPGKEEGEVIAPGKGVVMVIDDEDSVRNAIQTMLVKLGYTVIPARDGVEAVELYKKKYEEINLVIIDMIMPNMSGKEAYQLLREINPEIKSLLSTGYDRDGRVQEILRLGVNGFIHKPYRVAELSQKIKEILPD